MTEPFLVSVSRVNLYRRCPLAYKRRYILNEPDDLPEAWIKLGQLGKSFHEYCAAVETGVPPPAPVYPTEFHRQWKTLLATYHAQTWSSTDLVGVEEPLTIAWNDGDQPVLFRGIIDRLEIRGDRARIIDRKTGWKVASAEEMRDDLQLSAYAAIVAEHYPQVDVFEVEQVQYRYQGRSRIAAMTRADVESFREALVAEVGRILRDTEFLPSPTCNLCPPAVHARAMQPYRSVTLELTGESPTVVMNDPVTLEEAEQVAMGVQLAQSLAQVGKDVLRRWASEQGPVMLGEGAWGYWAREHVRCTDIRALYRWFLAHNVDPQKYLRVDTVAIRRLLEREPELWRYFVTEAESAFAWRANATKALEETNQIKEQVNQPFAVLEGGQ